VLVSGFAVLMFVFVRKALQAAAHDVGFACKLAQIKRSLQW
jgi:hypothetical protein